MDAVQALNFDRFYQSTDSEWGGTSGWGSNPTATLPYRQFLEKFIHLNNIKSVVDIGCGDWSFSKYIDFTPANYIGFDVVRSVVERNNSLFSSQRIKFEVMPATYDDIPDADLLIMKDVLQHLPNDDIFNFQKRLFPRYRRCLITNSFDKVGSYRNTDLPYHGAFRCLDLNDEPFNFGGSYVSEYHTPLWEVIRTLLLSGTELPAKRRG